MPGTPRRLTKDDVIQVLDDRERDDYPVMTTAEIVERVDASRPVVNNRLNELCEEEEPRVRTANKGQARVYWLAGEVMQRKEERATKTAADTDSPEKDKSDTGGQVASDGGVTPEQVEEIHKRTTREGAAIRMAGGVFLGLLLSLTFKHLYPWETGMAIAGVVIIYGLLYGIVFLGLKIEHNRHVDQDARPKTGRYDDAAE